MAAARTRRNRDLVKFVILGEAVVILGEPAVILSEAKDRPAHRR